MGVPIFGPGVDKALAALTVLSDHLSQRPTAYFVSQDDASNLALRVEAARQAQRVATDPATRTQGTIAERDMLLSDVIRLARGFVRRIKVDEGVAVQAKIDAGIPLPRVGPRQPIGRPATKPVMEYMGQNGNVHIIGFEAVDAGPRRGKPHGYAALQLFVALDAQPGTDPTKARLLDAYTRGPVAVTYSADDFGKVATYFGRWVNAKQQPGDFGSPVTAIVGAA